MTPQEKERFDKLPLGDQSKLMYIKQMLDKERDEVEKNKIKGNNREMTPYQKERFDKLPLGDQSKLMMMKQMLDKERDEVEKNKIKENNLIVDESEFNFFQTLAGDKYTEEEIEKYLKSDEYQEELEYSKLEMSDSGNWLNDMFEYFSKRKSVDEGVKYFKKIAGL